MSTHVPLEIELEIMKRLPVKSLIRFMSACKAWKSLINSSEFVSGYRVLPAHLLVGFRQETCELSNYVCFVDDDTFPQQKLALTFPPILQSLYNLRLIDSSCGLFCFYGIPRKPGGYNMRKFVLWNPSIRKSVAVVKPNHPFDYEIGFGVCPYTKDPKLVNIIYNTNNYDQKQVMVFTLSSGEWRYLSSNHLPRKSIQFVRSQLVIGQFIYWPALDDTTDGVHSLIMSFDLSTDEFRELDLPDNLRESNYSISRLRESLVLLDHDLTNKHVCDVWMMGNGDRKAFTKLFTIKAPDDALLWTVGFRNNGEPIVRRECDLQGALVVYEPCSGHIKDFRNCGTGHLHCVYPYMESLLLLDYDDGHIVSLNGSTLK